MGDIVNYDPESDVYEVHYDDGELLLLLLLSTEDGAFGITFQTGTCRA